MKITILGLSITSSWGNGHATTYRALVRALAARGHDVLFLERDVEWYAQNRDLASPSYCRTRLYDSISALEDRFLPHIRSADLVMVGSYVPQGIAVGDLVLRHARGVTAFYDIDTPVTLARIAAGLDYIAPRQVPRYDLYLSFTGGPTLEVLHRRHGARAPRALYCSVDPDEYRPDPLTPVGCDLGYLGTFSADRQPVLDRLMLDAARLWPAGRFVVAGPTYPSSIRWPDNVTRIEHLAPDHHRSFYTRARFTLNVTRQDMVRAGHSPSVRLFEAAACGTPIVSDAWPGIGDFFSPASEILLANDARHTLAYLRDMPEADRVAVGKRARARVLATHTSAHRAAELEGYVGEVAATARPRRAAAPAALTLERTAS
jgi:spore maturation protein CgeB